MDEVKEQGGDKTDEVKKQSGETPEFVRMVMSLIGGAMLVLSAFGAIGVILGLVSNYQKSDMSNAVISCAAIVGLMLIAALGAVTVSVFGKRSSSTDEIKKNTKIVLFKTLRTMGGVLIVGSILMTLFLIAMAMLVSPIGESETGQIKTNEERLAEALRFSWPILIGAVIGVVISAIAKSKLKKIDHGSGSSNTSAARIETMEVVHEGGAEKKEKELPPMLNADPDVAEKPASKIEPNNS